MYMYDMYVQSGKTYCAAFCASSVAPLAGLGYNASCKGLQWLETAADCNEVHKDVAQLINLYNTGANMKYFGISLFSSPAC